MHDAVLHTHRPSRVPPASSLDPMHTSIDRRQWLQSLAVSLPWVVPNGRLDAAVTAPSPRRFLFNCDGSVIHGWGKTLFPESPGPLTREQFVSLVFGPLENTAVDTLLFSFGSGNVAEYDSQVLEWPGQADAFQFPPRRAWHGDIEFDPQDQYRNPHHLAGQGHNPPDVIVSECRRRGLAAFASLRMNDTHDAQPPRGQLPNPELPTFKRQNLHWLVENLDRWTALDYRNRQVRALKLRVIEELFDRWDFDGIELDWLRHTLNFPRGEERKHAGYLTEFMREVRASLQQRAQRRGRRIEIAVRVPERLSWCLLGGYDVPTWIREDLFDALILGQGLTELPTLAEFRQFMQRRKIPIYPSLYSYGNGYQVSPDAVIRGSAANLWRDGADGLYTFNWFHYGAWRQQLINEIANPATLAQKQQHYTLVHKFDVGRSIGTDYLRFNTTYRAPHVPLELTVESGTKTVQVPVSGKPQSAELWVGLHFCQPGDQLTASLNGKLLPPGVVDAHPAQQPLGAILDIPAEQGLIGMPPTRQLDQRFDGLRWQLPVADLQPGHNAISLTLQKRGGGSDKSLQVARIEIVAMPSPDR